MTDTRAINLRLGDAVIDRGTLGHVESVTLLFPGVVKVIIGTSGGLISRTHAWNAPVTVRDADRKLPETKPTPRPQPRPKPERRGF